MGCILASKQISIYHKDDLPECINLTYDFDKSLLTPDLHPAAVQAFDDNEQLLKPAKAFHIEKVTVHRNRFITGLSITYKLDMKNKTVQHIGQP
jgi:hypothetical protein